MSQLSVAFNLDESIQNSTPTPIQIQMPMPMSMPISTSTSTTFTQNVQSLESTWQHGEKN